MSTGEHEPAGNGNDGGSTATGWSGGGRSRLLMLAFLGLACLALGVLGGIAASSAFDDDASTADVNRVERLAVVVADDVSGSSTTITETTPTDTVPTETATTATIAGGGISEVEPSAALIALVNRVPASDKPCAFLKLEGEERGFLRCTAPNGVVSIYEQHDRVSLEATYASLAAEVGVSSGQTPSPCPNLVPSELTLVRGGLTIGKLLCYEYEGKQWIAWTNEPMSTFAYAGAPSGMSAIDLYEWWQETDRPVLTDEELAFYARVPNDQRACEFQYVPFSQVQSVPPPDRGSTALCFVPNPKSPSDPETSMAVVYAQHFSTKSMNTEYGERVAEWGVTRDSGDCEANQPGESPWQQNTATVGRVACALRKSPSMVWTTDPVKVLSYAFAGPGMTLADLWAWWANESGPLYRSG